MAEHVDVLVVGAGLSGIGAACHLLRARPGRRVALLEAREATGGTWDQFRYPGVRSDSDMQTLGYRFRPWTGEEAIAGGASILAYLRATAAEAGVDRLVRLGHRVVAAAWSSAAARWTVTAIRGDGSRVVLTAGFLHSCTGYFDFEQGYTPDIPGLAAFAGPVIHPQHWPASLEVAGRRIVVIGSGATAMTLVPALAATAGHVTMLQRSPSYVLALPATDGLHRRVRALLGDRIAYPLTRLKNVTRGTAFYAFTRVAPNRARRLLTGLVRHALPPDFDVDTHFSPAYGPWDQRLCLLPDGDLFASLRSGAASIVTDRIEAVDAAGVRLASGGRVDADILITATGLRLVPFGRVELTVDGRPVSIPDTVVYKGAMLTGVPNFAFTFGYVNQSWTLRADLVSGFLVRLLDRMDAGGHRIAVPRADPGSHRRPFTDFSPGYIRRSIDEFPQTSDRRPWRLPMNYFRDLATLRLRPVRDGTIDLLS